MSDPNGYEDHSNQELPIPEAFQDSVVEAPFDNRFALLCLNANSPSPSKNHHQPCFNCGCTGCVSNSLKRRSPSSSSSNFQDPLSAFSPDSERHPKKLFLDHDDLTRQGFSKLSLPVPSAPAQPQAQSQSQSQPQAQVQVHPVLRRSVSDPYHPSITSTFTDPFAAGLGFQVPNPNPPQSPEEAKKRILQLTPPSNSGLPPLPPPLIRSVSDPTPSPAKTYSRSSSPGNVSVDLTKEKTPNSNSNSKKRLRRMRDCAIEMSKCYEQITREQEETKRGAEEENAATKDNCGTEFEESVFVEKLGEGLTIHFECPCGKGYQILLSGTDCYYKLM
ncbi:hypothetical protein CJ030_MR3G001139 [Morella rubra]|uniref:Uncharacterized protein n=1 Tax=Morella rubra TaxID=262757 RepID=A0A6A1W6N0_9ROSI|nr:hypothetical protein CJ030_MR3G001139 [Morella rubra]